jgi:hypothetical protein
VTQYLHDAHGEMIADVDCVDHARFTNYHIASAKAIRVIQESGQLMFVPRYALTVS